MSNKLEKSDYDKRLYLINCFLNKRCENCPLKNIDIFSSWVFRSRCKEKLILDTANLITQQKSEIKKLKAEIRKLKSK